MKDIKKFMIVNGWSDMNRGDSAIVLGMVQLLRKHFPGSAIYVQSEFDDNDPYFETGYWAIKSAHPEIQILSALFPYPIGANKIHKAANAVLTLAISWLVIAFPALGRYLFRGKKADTWRKIAKSDVLLSKGGHIFHLNRCSLQELYAFFKHAFPLLLGARLGKKVALYAQSVGPFHGTMCKIIAKLFFNRVDAISVRENVSFSILRDDLGITQDIYFVPDAAFLLSGEKRDQKATLTERRVIVTPRQWGFENERVFENYIRGMASIVDWLATKGFKVMLVSHTLGPTPSEDDRVAVNYLYKIAKSKDNIQIVNTAGLTANDLISLYASANLLIGTRFHSVIFALLSGIPVIAISYFGPKTFGIMKSLNMEKYVFDINRIDVEKIKSTIQYIFNNEEQIKKEIKLSIYKIKNRADMSGFIFVNSVLRRR